MRHASLGRPVGCGAKRYLWLVAVEVGVGTSAEDIGGELLVLTIFPILAELHVRLLHGRRLVRGINMYVFPVSIRAH